jgi:hypothetical protein
MEGMGEMFKKGLIWIGCSFIFNILESWLFGWNMTAQSILEKYCDLVSTVGIYIGLLLIFGYAVGKTIGNSNKGEI